MADWLQYRAIFLDRLRCHRLFDKTMGMHRAANGPRSKQPREKTHLSPKRRNDCPGRLPPPRRPAQVSALDQLASRSFVDGIIGRRIRRRSAIPGAKRDNSEQGCRSFPPPIRPCRNKEFQAAHRYQALAVIWSWPLARRGAGMRQRDW
jgi:hypothetical protein